MNRIKKRSNLRWSVGILITLFMTGFPQAGFAQSKSDSSVEVFVENFSVDNCVEYTNGTSFDCVSTFPFPEYIIFIDPTTGNLYLQAPVRTIEQVDPTTSDSFRIKATGKVKTCLLGQLGAEFSVNSFPELHSDFNRKSIVNCP